MMKIYLAFFLAMLSACQTNQTRTDVDQNALLQTAQDQLAKEQYDKAFTSYLALAEQNHPLAQFTLALFYQNGWGKTQDREQACHWFEKAAQQEIVAAEHFFAECLEQNITGSYPLEQAESWYAKAAEHGHFISWCSIAKLYIENSNDLTLISQKIENCSSLANSGNIPAQLQMGRFYLGKTVIHDPLKAKQWFRSAAQHNALDAMYYLGTVEQSFLQNPVEARFWFESAASQGYLPAYFPTAKLYFDESDSTEHKLRSPENLAKSYLWLTATANRSTNQDELEKTLSMLEKIKEIMPETWYPDLDEKVDQHLKQYAQ